MQIALDKTGNRIIAYDADKREEYRCPLCQRKVKVCQGHIKEAYFAHYPNDPCADKWNYDMSEWHRSMQSRFPENQREVVVTYDGKKHRADVLCKKQILEFQHSPISYDEIKERNDFYRAAGYSVAWVFDLQDQYDAGRIVPCDYYDGLGYKWSYPKSSFQCFPLPRKENTELVIYFYWINSDDAEEFNRVIWSKNDGEIPNFKSFIVSKYSIDTDDINSSLEVRDFFVTERTLLAEYLSELKQRYQIKYSGVKGHPRNAYICPRRPKEFGIKRSTEKACSYCRYCAAIKETRHGFESYCCYPNQVQEVDECHPGYESSGVPIF